MSKTIRILAMISAVIVLGFLSVWASPYWTHGEKVVTVTGVTTKRVEEDGQKRDIYLVFTDDQTYKNVDSPAYLKFNSSDVQGRLVQTGKYRITYYGFRIPALSMYRNIIKAEKVA